MSRAARTFALLVPFSMIAALIGGIQPAAAASAWSPAPDAQIRGGPADPTYIGDDIYNDDGDDQTRQRSVRPGFGDQFNIKMENDSQCTDSFFVQGEATGSTSRFKITYWYGGVDVTADVVAGTFETIDLDEGESDYLLAFIFVRRGTRSGARIEDLITITSSRSIEEKDRGPVLLGASDTVGATVLVNKKAGDFNSQLPIP